MPRRLAEAYLAWSALCPGTLAGMALPNVAYGLIGWFSTTRLDRALHPLLYRLTGGRDITGRVFPIFRLEPG